MFGFGPSTLLWLKGSKTHIDNDVFKLHYRMTVIILVVFVTIVGTRKYFGDPIDCTTVAETERLVDNYCWFNAYIIVPREPELGYEDLGDYHPYRPIINDALNTLEKVQKHPRFKAHFLYSYQWIEFVLFAQAALFFLPRYVWRYVWEQGRVRVLTDGLTRITLKPLDEMERVSDMVQFFRRTYNGNTEYTIKFISCEIFNFANVLTQFLLIHNIFNLDPYTLAKDFLESESNSYLEHPVNLVFPNMARCEVPNPRGGGTALNPEYCVLPVNVFVTKMYIFLWFHFLALTIITGLGLTYRLLTILLLPVRRFVLMRVGVLPRNDYEELLRYLSYGDWFFLTQLAPNIDPTSFKNLVLEYNQQMRTGKGSIQNITAVYNPRSSLASVQVQRETMYNSDYLAAALEKKKEKEMEKTISPEL